MESLIGWAAELHAYDYFGIILVVCLLECVIPKRTATPTLRTRWAGNISLTILDAFLIRSLFPVLGLGLAILCSERGWGLLNRFMLPLWLEIIVTLILLDAAICFQHYLLHRVPLLWRVHRVHHTDQDFDFTTGFRFHPIESVLTTAITLAAIAAAGPAPVAVLITELVFIFTNILGHGNLRVPLVWDRALRFLVVTPDMHRIHHSQDARESQSNFGNVFSFWDRLLRTYVAEPASGHERMLIGLEGCRDRKYLTLGWMLALPFVREKSHHPREESEMDVAPEGR